MGRQRRTRRSSPGASHYLLPGSLSSVTCLRKDTDLSNIDFPLHRLAPEVGLGNQEPNKSERFQDSASLKNRQEKASGEPSANG